MGALQILATQFEQVIVTTNIPELLHPMAPPNANYNLGWMPYHAQCEVFNISVGSAMNPRYGHPIRQILDHIGVNPPEAIPQPFWRERTTIVRQNQAWRVDDWGRPVEGVPFHLVEPIAYPEYDFLIHLNTDDDQRKWPFVQWAKLIGVLLDSYPGCSIGILGTDQTPIWNHHKPDPRPFLQSRGDVQTFTTSEASTVDAEMAQPGVEYVYNRSFESVASLIKHCRKAVLTIDSAASRIAHAVGSRNHVLLAPDYYPLTWSAHPNCYPYYGRPETWTVDGVLKFVDAAVQQLEYVRYVPPPLCRVDAGALWKLRLTCSTWNEWPRTGATTIRFEGGCGVIGSDVDLTRLNDAQVSVLVDLMQKCGLFDSVSTATERAG